MAQFEPFQAELEGMLVPMVFIAAQKREGMFFPEKFLKEHPTPFPFLLDENRAVTKAYGVYHRIGLDALNIARPAIFMIGRDRRVKFEYVGSSQSDRLPVEQVMAEVRKLKSGS